MDLLQQLKVAQQRVDELRKTGVDMTSREARRAMNRLVTLLRGASPDELESFDRWKKESTSHPA